MDRFIGAKAKFISMYSQPLKSNMDRFIETSVQIVDVNVFL